MKEPWTLEYDAEQRYTESLKPWSNAPGRINLSSATVATVGLLVTMLMVAALADIYGTYRLGSRVGFLTRLGFQTPTFALAALFWALTARRSDLGFALRVASWLPVVHVGLLVAGMFFYLELLRGDDFLAGNYGLLDLVSLGWGTLAICGFALLGLLIHGVRSNGRRQPRFLYGLAISCLTFTLLLGLWLPIAAEIWIPLELPRWRSDQLVFRENFVRNVLLLPAGATILLYSILTAVQAKAILASVAFKAVVGSTLFVLLFVGVFARMDSDVSGIVAYANLLPVLLCAALVSLVAMVAIALSHYLALRATRRNNLGADESQVGEVVLQAADSSAARLYNLGWFLGLRTQCAPFLLRTAKGDIPIPGGARLIAHVPLWTSISSAGESSPILKAGDRVQVTGFVAPPTDNAFRQSELPVAGSRGLVIVKVDEEATRLSTDLALVLWRPAILYLAVISAIALPGLAGFLAL